jgi:signal peptidase I
MKILTGLIIIASLLGCFTKIEDSVTFQGVSMLPSIKDGERIRLERFDRRAELPVNRGDIVMFLYPKNTSKFYIKRVVGLPNETVEIREGKVFIDGKELSEPYVDAKFNEARTSQSPVQVAEDSYYVLGDNRDNSADSRAWGFVPKKNILARAIDK